MRPGLSRFEGSLADALAPDSGGQACAEAFEEAVTKRRLPVFAPGVSLRAGDASLVGLIEAAREVLGGAGCRPVAQTCAPRSDLTVSPMSTPDPMSGAPPGPAVGLTANRTYGQSPHLSAVDPAGQVLELRRSLQDDFVLMAMPPAADDSQALLRASVLAVAMPSGWDPRSKAGLDFLEIHKPVAGAHALRMAAGPLSALLMREPWQRHVWTLSDSPALSAHPADRHHRELRDWQALWFRAERQISVPLPAARGVLFLIRVYVAPLAQVLALEPARAALLVSALQTMSPEVIAYKDLARYRELTLAALAK